MLAIYDEHTADAVQMALGWAVWWRDWWTKWLNPSEPLAQLSLRCQDHDVHIVAELPEAVWSQFPADQKQTFEEMLTREIDKHYGFLVRFVET